MEIKWYGTAAVSMTSADERILFDPFFSLNNPEKYISMQEILDTRHIFITHGHFDHTLHVPELLKAGQAKVYCHEIVAAKLKKQNVAAERIVCIKPGDIIELENFEIMVFPGEHISFDRRLIIQTLFNRRVFKWMKNLGKIINGFLHYHKGQVLIYNIKAEGKQILHLGSLGMCFTEMYPEAVDLMTLPFQGRSDMEEYALHFIRRIKPHAVFLQHFDDSFPPVSSEVDTTRFQRIMADLFPDIKIIKPDPMKSLQLNPK